MYNICYPLSSTCFRPHRPIIRRSKLYMQPMVFSPSTDVFVVRPLRMDSFLNGCMTKTSAEGENTIGFMYNLDLLMMGLLSQRPHDKDICRRGEYHRLHVQFRPPDDGPVRPETCRGKRIADIVPRRKNSVSS